MYLCIYVCMYVCVFMCKIRRNSLPACLDDKASSKSLLAISKATMLPLAEDNEDNKCLSDWTAKGLFVSVELEVY